MACEKKFRQEIDELKGQIKRMQENERKEKRKLAEEDAIKKISKMEEKIAELSKNLATQKQVLYVIRGTCIYFKNIHNCSKYWNL